MKISDFEKKVGLPRDTLRYYEKIGLLTAPIRSHNGYRHYGAVQLAELSFIERGKVIGFTLLEIKKGYERYKILGKLCPEFKTLLCQKKDMLAKRITEDKISISEINNMLK
jgi:MerR family copper efflux transcriptional regulator